MGVAVQDASQARDAGAVTRQLRRAPRGVWRVAVRCSHGHPQVIETRPALESGEPFPTLYYLTCPHLVSLVGAAESAGAIARYDARAREDAAFAARMVDVHREIRSRRAAASGGADPCGVAGVAGQRDPHATKCIHARVAAALSGVPDPVGLDVLSEMECECHDQRCGKADDDGR